MRSFQCQQLLLVSGHECFESLLLRSFTCVGFLQITGESLVHASQDALNLGGLWCVVSERIVWAARTNLRCTDLGPFSDVVCRVLEKLVNKCGVRRRHRFGDAWLRESISNAGDNTQQLNLLHGFEEPPTCASREYFDCCFQCSDTLLGL